MDVWSPRLCMALLVLDVTCIALHLITGWPVFDLDQEGNLSAWYSSAKLLGIALVAVAVYFRERDAGGASCRHTWLWLLVAFIFVGLSADETASMHERMARMFMEETSVGLDVRETLLGGDKAKDSFAWVLLFSPLILAVALFFAVFFYKRFRNQKIAAVMAMAGIACFLAAAGMEATILARPSFKDWTASTTSAYRTGTAVEESGEIFGTTLIFMALVAYGLRLKPRPIEGVGPA